MPYMGGAPDGILRKYLDTLMDYAIERGADVYIFGQWKCTWGRGAICFEDVGTIHNIHVNQGSRGPWAHENRRNHDGAIIIHYPPAGQAPGEWCGLFFAFANQTTANDILTGDPMDKSGLGSAETFGHLLGQYFEN